MLSCKNNNNNYNLLWKQLSMLLREIRYMKYLDKQGIPSDGLELYARNEKLQVLQFYI